jgi:hypothetical protein
VTHYKIEMTTQPKRPWWAFWRPKFVTPFFTVLADGKSFDANRLTIHAWCSTTRPEDNRTEVHLDGRKIEGNDTAEVWRDGVIRHRVPSPLMGLEEERKIIERIVGGPE